MDVTKKRAPREAAPFSYLEDFLLTSNLFLFLLRHGELALGKRFVAKEQRELVNYAQGWSFAHFLLHGMGKKGKKLLKGYFLALKAGRTREDAHAATFGRMDLRKLEAAWVAYVKRLKP